MDGRARWVDDVRIERWFRTPKGERLRSAECSTPRQLELEVAAFVEYHDGQRIHQALDRVGKCWCRSRNALLV